MSKKFGIFVAGGVIGAAIALLYAPRPGAETRALVAEKASEALGQAQDLSAQAAARGQEVYADAVARGQHVYSQAQEIGQTVYTNVTSAGQVAGSRVAAAGKQAYQGAKEGAHAAAQRAQSTTERVRPIFAEKNDELRAKIDAARERIAAQVTKNAEEAQASVADKTPIAAEGAASDVSEPEKIEEVSDSEDGKSQEDAS